MTRSSARHHKRPSHRPTDLEAMLGPTRKELLLAWLPWIGAALLLFLVGWLFVKPAPPKRVVILAGPKDGAYYAFAQRYARTFQENGVTLDVRATAGTVENYRLLAAGEGSLAIVQGGAMPDPRPAGMQAIASLYLEPVWIFHRGGEADQLADLRGRRVAIGPPGSGTRAIALRLLALNGIDHSAESAASNSSTASTSSTTATRAAASPANAAATLLPIGGQAAADALRCGEIDAAFFVISPTVPLVRDLLREASIHVMSFDRQEAYARLFPFLSPASLPRGVLDLSRDLPPHDVRLIAPVANLIAREDLHPTLVPLVCRAAALAHEKGDLLTSPGAFPSVAHTEFEVDPAAREYFKSGPPFLQRYLPFWVAALVDRLKILLLPLLTLLLPLMRIAPPLYVWRIRASIYRWYRVLHEIAGRLRHRGRPIEEIHRDLAVMAALEAELADVTVPLSYMQEFYNLRLHAEFVHRRLNREIQRQGQPDSADQQAAAPEEPAAASEPATDDPAP